MNSLPDEDIREPVFGGGGNGGVTSQTSQFNAKRYSQNIMLGRESSMDVFNPIRFQETPTVQEPEFIHGISNNPLQSKPRNIGAVTSQPNLYKGVKLNQTLVSHMRNINNNSRLDNSNLEPIE